MLESTSRRPGYTTGKEEEVWRGSPALRSTVYYWIVSVLTAWLIYVLWMKGFQGLNEAGLFGVRKAGSLAAVLFPNGQLVWWMAIVPWAIGLLPALWHTLNIAVISYEMTSQRLTVRSGILVRVHDQMELFRVRDFMIDTPIYLGILGLSHVRIISRDETLPVLTLLAQPNSEQLVNIVREYVQRRKDEVGMREFETNSFAP